MDLIAEIRAAFPATPYPGDKVLSDCWCEECAWSVRNLRGKSWEQAQLEDFIFGDGGHLSDDAFRYYLPALMILAIQHPDELHLAGEVNARLVAIEPIDVQQSERIELIVSDLSKPQRLAILKWVEWLNSQGWQAPRLIEAAIEAIENNKIVAIPPKALWDFFRAKEAEP